MSFTVIIASCNRPDRLERALECVRRAINQRAAGDGVVVADNGTHRPAREVVDRLSAAVEFPVRYVRTAPFNKAVALNAAIRAAPTEWLAFTDDDCLPDARWLAAAADYAARGEARVFAGRLEPGPVDFPLPRWLQDPPHAVVQWSPAFVDFAPLPQSGILPPGARVPFGANIIVAKKVFDLHGAYDEDLWSRCGVAALGSEDAEFAMRVRQRGEPIGYCAEALVVHPVFPERTTMSYYLRHIHHAGMREPLFAAPGTKAPLAYLSKSMALALVRGARDYLRGRHAHAVHELMNATRDFGEIRGWQRLTRPPGASPSHGRRP